MESEGTEGHPYYTQHLCHVIWEIPTADHPITDDLVQQAIELLLSRESSAYSALWDSLTASQKRFITAIANERVKHPYSSSFIERHGLSSPAAVKRVIEALERRDLVEKKADAIVIGDRFFKLWIVRISIHQTTS